MPFVDLRLGDCLDVLAAMEPDSVDTCITDPPYGLEFMGKDWDHGIPGVRFWQAVLRVLKPGAMLLAFGGTRTHHRLMCAIEDAGFEIRDVMMWVYGSGFPKSHSLGKATKVSEWDGWGTALKPAYEPIIVAMKPRDGTFAENALTWGVAGLWIDGARVPTNGENLNGGAYSPGGRSNAMPGDTRKGASLGMFEPGTRTKREYQQPLGRWPANLILDEAAGAMLDEMSGASRFFYCPKASRAERNAGLEGMEAVKVNDGRQTPIDNAYQRGETLRNNSHPCVKPVALLEYLCRLTKTPTGGTVLDPFMGSGSTGIACVNEGRDFIGIELDADYFEIAQRRIEHARGQVRQLELMP